MGDPLTKSNRRQECGRSVERGPWAAGVPDPGPHCQLNPQMFRLHIALDDGRIGGATLLGFKMEHDLAKGDYAELSFACQSMIWKPS
jgi:hypothetical protein